MKFVKVFAFVLLVGCSGIQNRESESERAAALREVTLISLEQNCFVETNKGLPIARTVDRINKNFTITSKISHNETVCECISVDKKFPEIKYRVKCRYLGNWQGSYVVFRYYETGGTGRFTDIILCSIDKDILRMNKVCCVGDRALDGIVNCPVLKDSRIYFKANLSINSLASLSKIDEKYISELSQASQDYWNVSDCMYDLQNDELHLLSISVKPIGEYSSDVDKILKIVIPDADDHPICITNRHIADFLKKFKSAYLSTSSRTD